MAGNMKFKLFYDIMIVTRKDQDSWLPYNLNHLDHHVTKKYTGYA